MRVRSEFQDLWHPSDCVGEIGAAATPCLLGVAYWAACKDTRPVWHWCRRATIMVGASLWFLTARGSADEQPSLRQWP